MAELSQGPGIAKDECDIAELVSGQPKYLLRLLGTMHPPVA
jgi:hypothetical protein